MDMHQIYVGFRLLLPGRRKIIYKAKDIIKVKTHAKVKEYQVHGLRKNITIVVLTHFYTLRHTCAFVCNTQKGELIDPMSVIPSDS